MQNDLIEKVEISKDSFDIINGSVPEEAQVPEIVENEVNIDETFTYNIAMNAMNDNNDQ